MRFRHKNIRLAFFFYDGTFRQGFYLIITRSYFTIDIHPRDQKIFFLIYLCVYMHRFRVLFKLFAYRIDFGSQRISRNRLHSKGHFLSYLYFINILFKHHQVGMNVVGIDNHKHLGLRVYILTNLNLDFLYESMDGTDYRYVPIDFPTPYLLHIQA